MLKYFKNEFVSVFTNITVEAGNDEEGYPLSARQAYVGYLLDYDDSWVVLGEIVDNVAYPSAAISIAEVVYIELKLDAEQEALQAVAPTDILN